MKNITINRNIQWLHIHDPKESEIKYLKEKFNVHPLILDELLVPSDRSKVENYGDYLFVVYHLPIYNMEHRTSRRSEIDFIVTKKTLVSVSYEELDPVVQFERDLESRLNKKDIKSTAEILYYLLEETNNFSLRQLKHVEKKVNFVGDQLFRRQDRKLLEEISHIKRDILDFTTIAGPQKSTLDSLLEVGSGFWGKDIEVYFADLQGDFLRVGQLLENLRATVQSYSETISQLFEFKTSEVIRRFSILGFLTFPLILYATIALQPTVEKTFIHTASDFWQIFSIIAILVGGLALYFRKKGWL